MAITMYVLCSVGFGMTNLADLPLAQHHNVAKFLASIAATLFAILGVWIAVLDPKGLLNAGNTKQPTADQQLIIKLLQPWLYATATFAFAVVVAFALGVLQGPDCNPVWLQKAFGGLNMLMLLLILDSLLSTLLPIAHIRSRLKLQQSKNANRQ